MFKRIRVLLLTAIIGMFILDLSEQVSIPFFQGAISTAEAIVGRPLTPVSVGGVARRTVRRCAVGAYNC